MEIKETPRTSPGNSVYFKQKNKKPKKMYHYTMKNLTSMKFDDMIDIFGIDVACKLVKEYSGCRIYIPRLSSLKKDLKHTLIRAEWKMLKRKGKPPLYRPYKRIELARILRSKYGLTESIIFQIVGEERQTSKYPVKAVYKKKIQISKIRDKNLLYIMQNYWDKLKDCGLV